MPGPGIHQNSNGEALQRLLVALDELPERVEATEEEYHFLVDVLQNRELQALVQVHSRIGAENGRERPKPVTNNAQELSNEVLDDLLSVIDSSEAHELSRILQKPHVQAVLTAHDRVAQEDYWPKLPDVPHEVDEDEETVKIVQLVKSNEPLGATIKVDERTGTIIIARIMHGGAADRSGLIQMGDEVHEVNGINVRGKTPNDVLRILQSLDGTITFKLIPSDGKIHARESKVRVRAHFDYEPRDDRQIPCRDAGLGFFKGDVLHIVNQDDPNWWQARREGDRNMRAGLVPGRLLQERRILAERQALDESSEDEGITISKKTLLNELQTSSIIAICKSPVTTIKKSKKTKKIMYEAKENDDYDREEIATYEEVARLYPRHGIYRPIILIGPPGVGRNELKRRVIANNPDHFKTTIPHTSRPKKPMEVEGNEYFFVNRDTMEEEIRLGRFVEHGEYKGNLYGTSVDTVKSIINAGYVCIMNPHPQALKMLRTPELKPYVVFVKPPHLQRFKDTRYDMHARSTFDEYSSRGFTDDECNDIIHSANRIEFHYSHWFDATVVNDNLTEAYEQLMLVIDKVELEPQWVPASWVN